MYAKCLGQRSNVVTFRVSRRRREMYIGHVRLSVCMCVSVYLSVTYFKSYCPDTASRRLRTLPGYSGVYRTT